ncbi:ferrochelatase [Neptunicella sp. SCSIO 80796]|uniref:ferrochelatase n=1 Tax=Neptunicella plasticusilytica TaxID=3117012 RepID=UPI003A4E037B
MQYKNNPELLRRSQDKIGILLTNLGTPDAPSRSALKRYLAEFLADPRVVETPRWLWWFILKVILVIRPAKSAKSYQEVWTKRGSPLLFHTQDQCDAVCNAMKQHSDNIVVEFAMRYGSPSIDSAIDKMVEQGVGKLLVLPLYPQYSASTNASTFDAVSASFRRRRWFPELRFINHYYQSEDYIQAQVSKIKAYWHEHGQADKLLFSFHGIPQKYVDKGDPYQQQCVATAQRVAQQLGLNEEQYLTTFQSRFGREEWLKPYTDMTLKQLGGEGVKSVQVVCPGFSADCLETIEEIGIENRDYFLEAGGETYQYIPALNADPEHIQALTKLLQSHIQGWFEL